MGEAEGSREARTQPVRPHQFKSTHRLCAFTLALVLWLLAPSLPAQPVVLENPQDTVVTHGQRVTLHFDAVADTRLRYRWVFNDRYISARGRTLRFRAVPRRAGVYRALAIDRTGQYVFSAPATVEVLPRSTSPPPSPQQPPQPSPLPPRPVIVVQPQDVTVREHDTAVFRVTLNDSGPYTTMVWHNDNPLEGSHQIPDGLGFDVHSPRLAIPNALNADNYNGLYWIAVTNRAGGTVSRKARLTVVPE